MKNKDVLIIDGTNLVFRMFYTFMNLSNNDGYLTGAVYGFLNMLLYYQKTFDTCNIIICWEGKSGQNWREKVYPKYKANRKASAESDPKKKEVHSWIHRNILDIIDITTKCGLVNVTVDENESDDLIAYFTMLYGKDVKIVTNDKDMMQLVNDKKKIRVIRPDKTNSYIIYNEKKVFEEYKVNVGRIPKLLAIKGDSSDNISGISGYGDKKAVELTNNYIKMRDTLTEQQIDIINNNLKIVDLLYAVKRHLMVTFKAIRLKDIQVSKAQEMLNHFAIRKFTARELYNISNHKFKVDLFRRIRKTF